MTTPPKLGKYTLVRHIATGGMAEIYLAEQAGPGGFNKELVIKRILPHMAQDESFVRMFLDEARLVAQLSHPKIAQIYDLGEIEGQYFIAMEFVDGLDLAEVIAGCRTRGGQVPIPVVVKIVIDLLEALDYAHDFTDREGNPYGLVHRDISPHNVLLSNDGIVKLVDFGVAKAQQNKSKTQTGAVKGKFAYMAPEQIQSKELDRRADLFAVGVLLYELLTGEKPFGDELTAVTAILTQPHPDPRTYREEIPAPLVAIIDRALSKDREGRYGDAHEMVRELEAYARSSSEYVGDREVASFIRNLRGIPTTRDSSQGELSVPVTPLEGKSRVTPIEDQIPATRDLESDDRELAYAATGAHVATPGDGTPYVGQSPAPRHPGPTAEVGNVPGASQQPPAGQTGPQQQNGATMSVDGLAEPEGEVSAAVIAIFFVLLLAIICAAGAAFYLVMYGDGDEEADPIAVTQPETSPAAKETRGDLSLLRHPGGLPVHLSSKPSSDVYVDGKLVGPTPIQTQLKPGSYTVEFRTPDTRREKTFEVEPGKPFQTYKFEL